MVCRYCKDTVTRLITSINGVSRVNVNVPDRTVNVTYDSRITDAHVIRMTLLEAGYKNIREPVKVFLSGAVLKNRVGGISDGNYDRSLWHDLWSLPEKSSGCYFFS